MKYNNVAVNEETKRKLDILKSVVCKKSFGETIGFLVEEYQKLHEDEISKKLASMLTPTS